MVLELLISIVTITQMYLLTRKIKLGLYIGIISQVLWVIFIIDTQSWGLVPLNIWLWWIFITGIKQWDKE